MATNIQSATATHQPSCVGARQGTALSSLQLAFEAADCDDDGNQASQDARVDSVGAAQRGLMTPENAVKKAVLDLLAVEGIFAFRLNSASVQAEYKGKQRFFSAHSLGKGAADIRADVHMPYTHHDLRLSLPLWIECKAPGGRQSFDQEVFQRWVEKRGHSYLLAFSSDDVVAWLKANGVKR